MSAFEGVAIVAVGTAVTFASLDPAVFRPVAEVEPQTVALPVLLHIDRVMAGLVELRSRVQFPGVALVEAEFGADGRSVTLTAWSVRELSNWYDAVTPRATVVGGRYEERGGRQFALGGLDWELHLDDLPGVPGVRVYVRTDSAEGEPLPDTALVRAMCPWEASRREVAAREAAAGRQVAA